MQDITIYNFRCYKEKSMTFRSGINLLIGDNAAGKTSLLRACNLAINSFFSGYSDEYTNWKSAEDEDFRVDASIDTISSKDNPINISFHLNKGDLAPIHLRTDDLYEFDYNCDLRIEKKSKKNARNLITGLKPLKEYASILQSDSIIVNNGVATQLNPLPIFAYYSTEDIHTKRKFNKKEFKKYPQKPSFGYIENFDSRGMLDYWIFRLLALREAKKGEEEILNVRNAIIEALGENGCNIIRDVEIRPINGDVMFKLSDNREVKSDLLSDGYRRLVSIVTDIAFRCALLNKTVYGTDAYKKTHGTVIIDEIDEHLHPALQLRVLKALHLAFPHLQFIVSTHSPLVISSVEPSPENVVYRLDYDKETSNYSHKEFYAYGLDASTIINIYMNQASRDLDIDNEIKRIRDLIDSDNLQDAKKALKELRDKTGTNDPEFANLEARISFLE